VLKYDIKTQNLAETRHEQSTATADRVRRARNFGLSQVWARRVRRKVVSIIETQHLTSVADYEPHLQNYAAKVWRVLNLTRGRRADKRPAMLEEAIQPYLGEGGPKREHLEAVREGLIEFFQQAEMAGQLDVEPQLEPGDDRAKHGFQPKPDRRPERDAWDKARAALVEQLWQETSRLPELAGLDPQRAPLYLSVVRQLCSIVDHQAPESDECKTQVEAKATDEHFSARGRDPALVRRLAQIVIPRWEELRSTLGPHPLGRVRPPK